MQRLPIIGRLNELRFVRDVGWRGSTHTGVVIAGPAGVGKTRLAEEATAAGPPRSVLTLIGTPAARCVPLAPLLAMLPEGGTAGVVDLAAIRARLAKQRPPLTLVVDDAQWLDGETLTLLHSLAAAREARMIITVRDDAPIPVTILNLCKDGYLARLDLGPLPSAEAAELVVGVLGVPAEAAVLAELVGRSQGLPLALRELTEHALATGAVKIIEGLARAAGRLPRSRQLSEIIASNLGQAEPACAEVLSVVALAEPVPLELLTRAVDAADLIAAEKHGLIRVTVSLLPDSSGPIVTAGHPLYAESALAMLSPLTRHRILERLIAAAPPPAQMSEALLLRIAVWRLEAGHPVAAEDLLTALRWAHRGMDLDRALVLARQLWRQRLDFDSGLLYATALLRQQQYEPAERLLRRLEPLASTDAGRVARASLINEVLARLGRHDEGIEELCRAERAVADRAAQAHLVVRRAFTTTLNGHTRQALEIIGPMLRGGDPQELRQAAEFVPAMLGWDGRGEEALALVELAERLESDMGVDASPDYLPTHAAEVARGRGHALLHCGRLIEAAACADAGIRAAQETGLDYELACWIILGGRVELERGHPATAILQFGRVLAEMSHVAGGMPRAVALNALIEAHALLGQTRSAQHALAELAKSPHNTLLHPAGLAEMARGHLAAGESRQAAARELFAAACRRAAPANASIALIAAHAVARHGEPELGVALARDLPRVQGPLALARHAHMAALVSGDEAGLVRVATEFERLGADLLAAEGFGVASGIAARRGDTRSANQTRRLGLEVAARIEGARTPGLLALARPEAQGLTRRQREIAMLAARGLSSQAIAGELFLSVRTIDNHLQQVYHRLGISGRQEITEALTLHA